MKLDIGLMQPGFPQEVVPVARAAEDIGFDALWVVELSHDPFLQLAIAAEHTSHIKLGTSIAVAFPRSPLVLAQLAWDLQAQSQGRFILGLGTQVKAHNERRFGVHWEHPVAKLREVIQMIHAIWDCWQNGTRPDFQGQFYRFTLMTPAFNPGPIAYPRPPIYLAGVNDRICSLAGELCDGLRIHPVHSVKYLDEVLLPNIQKGLDTAGRQRSDLSVGGPVFVIAGANGGEIQAATASVREKIAFYGSTPAYHRVWELHGWGETARRLTAMSRRGEWVEMANEVTDEMLDVFAVTGTYDEIAETVRKKYASRLDRLDFYLPFAGSDTERWRTLVQAFNR